MRLIDADELLKKCFTIDGDDFTSFKGVSDDDIKEAQTVDAAPVVHAHWKYDTSFGTNKVYVCSKCNRPIIVCPENGQNLKDYPYCHCGAKMDEEVKE